MENNVRLLNLTQHDATKEQIKDGLVDPNESEKSVIRKLLTFDDVPTAEQMIDKSMSLYYLALHLIEKYKTAPTVMLAGAPWFLPLVEHQLKKGGVKAVYSFSKRCVEEQISKDGKSVKKVSVFKHVQFIGSPYNLFLP